MHDLLIGVIVVAAIVAVAVKRFAGEPLNARDAFLPPLVLTGVGLYSLTKIAEFTAVDLTWIVITTVVGFALGAVRGSTMELFTRNGVLWQRYTVRTLVVWVVAFGVSFGLGALAVAAGMHPEVRPMPLSIGIGLLGEMVPIGLRALRSGVPFAPDRPSRERR